MLRKKSLLALLLSLCMVVGILPATVFAAGQYVPENPRWSGYGNQVMWDKPANASGSTYLEYEAQLVLNGQVLQTESVEINRWVFFNNLTEPQEAYTLKVRARQIYLTGDPDGSYTVWKRDAWGDWAIGGNTGGGEGPTPPHEHSFGGWKNNGTQHWKECSCGEKSEESPHNFGEWELIYYDVNTKYDVCERRCLTCGYEEIDQYREHQHYYTDDWRSGSTTHWKECYYCKEVNQDTVANHTFGDWTETKPATTTEEGLRERTCSVCEYTQKETIPVHEHSIHDETWKYNDTEHWQECSCGEKLNVANHIYGDWRETKPATETEAGSRERDCTVCDYVQTETIPMLEHEHSYGDWQKDETQHWKECRCGEKTEVGNHTFDDWTITKEPTTTETGSRERTCSICKYTQEETIPVHEHSIHDEAWKYDDTDHWQECSCGERLNVANHIYGDWKTTKEATETEEGSKERGCTVCKYVQVEDIPMLEHKHGIHDEAWKYDETQHWQECSCGEKLNVANHTYGDWKVTKEATETEAGSRERGCAVCEYVQVEIIPEIGHEHGIHDETWKYDKTQHWQECSCGEKLNVATHIYGDWRETKPATETEAGSRERDCTVCDHVQTETIPMLEHEHGIHDETWKYDKTQHWQECSCGEKLNVANHIYGDWKVTKEATETEAGSRERGCAVCEYVQTEAIPAAGTGEPTDSTDPTDSSDSQGQQDPSGDTGSPQTGDSSNMMLWISLMLASCGGVLGMLLYRRKKAAAGK